jgi:putative PIN family toxin of toxin-antitoxin system
LSIPTFLSAPRVSKDRFPTSPCIKPRNAVLLKSAVTEAQFYEVIARSYLAPLITPAARDWLAQLMAAAELVPITERITACRDPTDDKFLELAVSGHPDFILTGDKDLLVLNPFGGVPIVAPIAFVRGAAV